MRYINSLNLSKEIKFFILIEPGEGYMIPVLQKEFPDSKIIALHVNETEPELILERELSIENIPHDFQKTNASVASIVKIIEWRPSLNYYKEAYVKLLSTVVKYIKRLDAEKRTVNAFGARWMRNFFRNLGNIKAALLYKETEVPVIITGSGPSLKNAIPVIKEAQENSLIIAASSSFLALSHFGVKPDFVIATDGGGWAIQHLHPIFRSRAQPYLAVSLCAALPSQCSQTPQLILNDGSLWQNIILNELQMPSVLIPQRGTVTATAVELALLLTKGNIYLAGTDLAVNDIRTHVKPYAFDYYLLERDNRFSTIYSQSFLRSKFLNEGSSMEIYAEWFKNQYDVWPKRIFNISEKSSHTGIKTQREEHCFKITELKDVEYLHDKGIDILLKSLENDTYSDQLKKELNPLLGEEPKTFLSSLRRCGRNLL